MHLYWKRIDTLVTGPECRYVRVLMIGTPSEIGTVQSGCLCEPCPSYTECMRAEGEQAFCRHGRTPDCMFDRKGCLCPACSIHPAENPMVSYYCAWGSSGRHGKKPKGSG